jgi:hypothetical protein
MVCPLESTARLAPRLLLHSPKRPHGRWSRVGVSYHGNQMPLVRLVSPVIVMILIILKPNQVVS